MYVWEENIVRSLKSTAEVVLKTSGFAMHLLFQIHLNAMLVAAVEKHDSKVPLLWR